MVSTLMVQLYLFIPRDERQEITAAALAIGALAITLGQRKTQKCCHHSGPGCPLQGPLGPAPFTPAHLVTGTLCATTCAIRGAVGIALCLAVWVGGELFY